VAKNTEQNGHQKHSW